MVVADHCAISYPVAAEAVSRAKRTDADDRLTERASPTWSLGWRVPGRHGGSSPMSWIDRLRRQTAMKLRAHSFALKPMNGNQSRDDFRATVKGGREGGRVWRGRRIRANSSIRYYVYRLLFHPGKRLTNKQAEIAKKEILRD